MKKNYQKGTTLQELLTVIAIIALLSGVIYSFFIYGRRLLNLENYTVLAENEALKASLVISRELREAQEPEGTSLSAIEEAGEDSLIFYADVTNEGENNMPEKIEYSRIEDKLYRRVAYWDSEAEEYGEFPPYPVADSQEKSYDLAEEDNINKNIITKLKSFFLKPTKKIDKAKAENEENKIDMMSIYNEDNDRVTASHHENHGHYIINDLLDDAWGLTIFGGETPTDLDGWWKIDLANSYEIDYVRIWRHAGSWERSTINCSTDGINFTEIGSWNIDDTPWMWHYYDVNDNCRYLKIDVHSSIPLTEILIAEFEAYGVPAPGDSDGDGDGDSDSDGDGDADGDPNSRVICNYVRNTDNPVFSYYDSNYTGSQDALIPDAGGYVTPGLIRVIKLHLEVDVSTERAPDEYVHDLIIRPRNL